MVNMSEVNGPMRQSALTLLNEQIDRKRKELHQLMELYVWILESKEMSTEVDEALWRIMCGYIKL